MNVHFPVVLSAVREWHRVAVRRSRWRATHRASNGPALAKRVRVASRPSLPLTSASVARSPRPTHQLRIFVISQIRRVGYDHAIAFPFVHQRDKQVPSRSRRAPLGQHVSHSHARAPRHRPTARPPRLVELSFHPSASAMQPQPSDIRDASGHASRQHELDEPFSLGSGSTRADRSPGRGCERPHVRRRTRTARRARAASWRPETGRPSPAPSARHGAAMPLQPTRPKQRPREHRFRH